MTGIWLPDKHYSYSISFSQDALPYRIPVNTSEPNNKRRLKIDARLLRLHQLQVLHQCNAALLAIEQMNTALQVFGREDQELLPTAHETLWASIQNFLTSVANIAKACWGQGGRLADARAPLRRILSIEDDSPLSNTELRNHLEHYDERLDRWYEKSNNHFYVDYGFGPRATTIRGVPDTDVFRFFDPETNEVIFWGEHYAIQPLVDAVCQLLTITQTESMKFDSQ